MKEIRLIGKVKEGRSEVVKGNKLVMSVFKVEVGDNDEFWIYCLGEKAKVEVKAGQKVFVVGHLELERWDGGKFVTVGVLAESVKVLGERRERRKCLSGG